MYLLYLTILLIQMVAGELNGSKFDLEGYLANHEYKTYRPKTCDERYTGNLGPTSQWMWLPIHSGKLRPRDSRSLRFEGNCFNNIEMTMLKIQGYKIDI